MYSHAEGELEWNEKSFLSVGNTWLKTKSPLFVQVNLSIQRAIRFFCLASKAETFFRPFALVIYLPPLFIPSRVACPTRTENLSAGQKT